MTVYRGTGHRYCLDNSTPLPSIRRQPVILVPATPGDLPSRFGEVTLAAAPEVLRVEG